MSIDELKLKIKMDFKVVHLLIAINVFMFILTSITNILFSEFPSFTLIIFGAEFLPDIASGQLWRLIMSSFLHANLIHIVINMWALWNIGGIVERFYGGKKTITIYIFTAISASVLSVLAAVFFYVLQGDPKAGFSVSVGASGAVFGFVGLIIGDKFRQSTYSISISEYVNYNQLLVFVGYNVLIGLGFNLLGTGASINNWAHIGGLLGGMLLGVLLEPINSYNNSKFKHYLQNILFWLCIIATVASFIAQLIYISLIFY